MCFPTCVKVIYLRIRNISLALVLKECQCYCFASVKSKAHIKKPLQCSLKKTITEQNGCFMCLHNERYISTDNVLFVWWDSNLVLISVIMTLVLLSLSCLRHVTFSLYVKISRYCLICYLVTMF